MELWILALRGWTDDTHMSIVRFHANGSIKKDVKLDKTIGWSCASTYTQMVVMRDNTVALAWPFCFVNEKGKVTREEKDLKKRVLIVLLGDGSLAQLDNGMWQSM